LIVLVSKLATVIAKILSKDIVHRLYGYNSLYLLTYLTLTPLTGAITHTDIQNLTPILKKIKILWPILKPLLTYKPNSYLQTLSYKQPIIGTLITKTYSPNERHFLRLRNSVMKIFILHITVTTYGYPND